MAGTIPLSMTQQFNEYGEPLSGGQLYIIQAGTVSTPQDAFVDLALTIKQPYPMTLDAAGRVPQFFLADGTVKVRLQDASGVVQLSSDSVLVIGPSAGGGGGAPVDPTQLVQLGSVILRYGVGGLTGYVRLNGLTIGSATSGGTERANADCQALFQHLWGVDVNLVVSGGRGANAAADWTANKQITLPDFRGRLIAGLDDMGNAPAGVFAGASFSFGTAIALGSKIGASRHALGPANIPNLTSSGTNAISVTSIGPPVFKSNGVVITFGGSAGSTADGVQPGTGALAVVSSSGSNSISVTSQGTGGSQFDTLSAMVLATFYIKL